MHGVNIIVTWAAVRHEKLLHGHLVQFLCNDRIILSICMGHSGEDRYFVCYSPHYYHLRVRYL